MNAKLTVTALASLGAIPLLAQFRLQPVKPAPNPLARAIHSFVTRNANLPLLAQPKTKPPQKRLPIPIKPIKPPRLIASNNVCSIPLTNVRPPANPNWLNMPTITPPRDLGRMPMVQGPAPPCDSRPVK